MHQSKALNFPSLMPATALILELVSRESGSLQSWTRAEFAYRPWRASKPIGQLHPKAASVLFDLVLKMFCCRWIIIFSVQQVVDTGGGFQALDDPLSEQGQIHHEKGMVSRP